jgi:colanic acid/amylovoran biosynthesis glycosyltransferase
MKIAFVTNIFPVLYNTFTVNEIMGLVERGHDVTVFSLQRWDRNVVNENALKMMSHVRYFDEFMGGGIHVRFLVAHSGRFKKIGTSVYDLVGRWLLGGDGSNGCAEQYYKKLGWTCYGMGELGALLKRDGFDIIHAGYGNRPAEAAMLLSRLTGIPFSFEAHAYDLFVDFPFAGEKLNEARKIFTISHYNKKYLTEQLNCPAHKISVMRVPFNKEHCDRVAGKVKDKNLVVAVCRLHPIKGLESAFEAIRLVMGRHPNVQFVVVGDGPLEPRLAEKIRMLSLGSNIRLAGSMGNEQALEIVARAAVCLLPSVIAPDGDRDGIPTSLIEAMYLETPVVSTRVSGIPELVDHDINGFLAEPGDVPGLAAGLEKLLSDETLRSAMGKRAKEKVETGFYTAESAEILLDGWQGVVETEDSRLNESEHRDGVLH